MTAEEAKALKAGDVIEAKMGDAWAAAVVVLPAAANGSVAVRRAVKRNNGGLCPFVRKRPHKLRQSTFTASDPLSANVYADFLEERGFGKAARALREAFPLAGGEVKS